MVDAVGQHEVTSTCRCTLDCERLIAVGHERRGFLRCGRIHRGVVQLAVVDGVDMPRSVERRRRGVDEVDNVGHVAE